MKKNLKIIFLIIIILGSSYFIYKNWNNKEKVVIDNIQQLPIQNEGLIVASSYETKVLNPSNAYVKFDVKYPSFKNVSPDFNSQIETLIKTSMDDHIKASKEYWQSRIDTQMKGENIPKIPTKNDKLSFFSDFTVVQSNSNYISFVLKYGGFSGGAHGYENYVSFNYDLKNKKVVELKDLFANDSNYLTTISTKSRVYLKKQFATVSKEDKDNSSPEAIKEYVDNIVGMIESGTEPTVENFSVFTFTGDKVKIYFAQYQVGPYVIGMPEIEIDRK
jgi:hypothetical protein